MTHFTAFLMCFGSKFLILTPFYAFLPHFESDLTHFDFFSKEKVSFFKIMILSKNVSPADTYFLYFSQKSEPFLFGLPLLSLFTYLS